MCVDFKFPISRLHVQVTVAKRGEDNFGLPTTHEGIARIRRCEFNGFLNNYFLESYDWARKLSCNIAVKEGYRGEITQPTNFRRCIASGAYISGMGWPSVP